MMVIWLPGKGKSTFLNYLIDGYDSQRFATGKGASSVTTKVKKVCRNIFDTDKKVIVYDVLGALDGSISLKDWTAIIQNDVGSIDLIMLVVSSHDRADVANSATLKLFFHFVNNFSWNKAAIIFTHCDQV